MEKIQARFRKIGHTVLVLSGKGGVGKSTVTVQLAMGLVMRGHKVGILDVDVCGPSIPRITGLEGKEVRHCSEGWVPVYADSSKSLSVMSIGFLLSSADDAVVWRGPKKNAMIRQFLGDVFWDELDYLFIDTPPGTGDEHLSLLQYLEDVPLDGAVLVTTPQRISVDDVLKEVTFCKQGGLPILGVVENMSGFVCPCCGERSDIFLSGGGKDMAMTCGVPFLGAVPLDPELCVSEDTGQNFLETCSSAQSSASILGIIDAMVEQIELRGSVEATTHDSSEQQQHLL